MIVDLLNDPADINVFKLAFGDIFTYTRVPAFDPQCQPIHTGLLQRFQISFFNGINA
jgi:hypothetical protein